ncbi:MFS transporter [Clostridium sporogenes]|uniref:MFS transporter n=1 Tax=Clostridium sporogenes TaxID=1509 RepID=UPI0013D77C05|nr:MFS transporter [Clostridium sporogenes]NFV14542.1 MFS transporter [Clostridium sporogenes]
MNNVLLKNKSFILLIWGNFTSLLGTQALSFSLSLYVLNTSGSATKFASVLAISIIPQLILTPVAGVIVDWVDRKKIIVSLDFINFLILGGYYLYFQSNNSLSIYSIYLLVIILSIISAIFNPAISTIIPSIIDKEVLISANGFNNIFRSIATFVAPLIAGYLFGIYGISIILILNSICFFISSISELFINIPKNYTYKEVTVKQFIKDFKEGLIFLKNKSESMLLNIAILGLVINFVYTPIVSIGFNYIAKINLSVSDYQLGMLNSISILSVFLAPILCNVLSKKFKLGKILFLDISCICILFFILSITNSNVYINLFKSNFIPYINLIIISFLLSLVSSTGNLVLTTIYQKETPIDLLGRVNSVFNMVGTSAVPLGQIAFGLLFDNFSVSICLFIGTILLLFVILFSKKKLLN